MRAVFALAVAAGLLPGFGCAHVEPPSGGPEDRAPPALLTSRPDSLAVVPDWDSPVVLVFDERVSEQEIDAAVRVSPRTGDVVVDHRGDEIRVSLRGGWQRGLIYHVTVLPTVRDLFGNERVQPLHLVFSTGPEIPATLVAGSVTDRITGEPQPGARVEMIRSADSLVYAAAPDSAGQLRVQNLPTGDYLVRAYMDQDLDLALDDLEPRDSALVTVRQADTARVELAIVAPDSTGPQLASVALVNGILELRFDDYLDPALPAAPRVEVRGPGGEVVEIAEVRVGSLGAGEAGEVADTAVTLLPSRTLTARFAEAAELTPEATYQVTVRSVVNVVGLSGEGESEFTAPAAVVAPDSLTTDTVGVRSLRSWQ